MQDPLILLAAAQARHEEDIRRAGAWRRARAARRGAWRPSARLGLGGIRRVPRIARLPRFGPAAAR